MLMQQHRKRKKMMTTFGAPQENISCSALRHFSATSSYFTRFFFDGGADFDANGKIHEEAKRLLADHPNLSKSLFTQNRSFLEYLPFINPFIRGFNPNLLLNEGTNTMLPPGEQHLHSYKTVMCEAWLLTAHCGYGTSCRFAHGLTELRKLSFPKGSSNTNKYQTKICVKYTTHGICCHGPACLFLHPLPDNPKLFLAPLLATENGIHPMEDETTREYYLMSRSFYMENQYFDDPYNNENVQPQYIAAIAEQSNCNNGTTKLLDLVFDENGNIIQHILTSKPSSSSNISE